MNTLLFAIGGLTIAGLSVVLKSGWHPNPLDPVAWPAAPRPPKLKGAWASNELLENTELLHQDAVFGPEAFALHRNGTVYTGTSNGLVLALDENGEQPRAVFFVGGFLAESRTSSPAKNGLSSTALLTDCKAGAGQLPPDEQTERTCGRPLGLEFDPSNPNKLWILDTYYGLFQLDVTKNKAVLSMNAISTKVQAGPGTEQHSDAERSTAFLNDLAFAPDGKSIYLTDSSWKHSRAKNRAEILDAAPRGRLLRFDLRSKKLSSVLCGLHFPNGLTFTKQNSLLIVESMRFRVLELSAADLNSASGVSPEPVKVWADRLPGFGDNLWRHPKTGHYLLGCGAKAAAPFSLLRAQFKLPLWIRRYFLGGLLASGAIDKLVPRYGLVLEFDGDGKPVTSYHDPTGRTAFISSVLEHPASGYTFLGSSQNPHLGRVRLPDAILPVSAD